MSKENMEKFKPDVFEMFYDICKNNINKMNDFAQEMKSKKVKTFPTLGDTRNISQAFSQVPKDVLDEGKAHLVVTSPPYGDHGTTVAYGQFSKHPGLWLELENEKLRQVDTIGLGGTKKDLEEINSSTLDLTLKKVQKNDEALAKKVKPNRSLDVFAYFYDVDTCLQQISKFLKQGESYCCFVVANRTVRRVPIPTDQISIELAAKHGFKHVETIYRTIANKAMATKNAPENVSNFSGETMTRESIVIWKY